MSPRPRTTLPVATGREAVRALGQGVRRLPGLAWSALGAAMLSSAAGVSVPLLLGRIVDVVLTGAGHAGLLPLVALLLVAALITGILIAVANRLCAQLGLRLAAGLREQAMDKAPTS